ncbi:class I SAM-dependent methyltransferase [Methanobacterium sp.]|uniref:class I SAM-dependent methyltransferase n=1 Tax=Methanobacterium sp. TaxID=2164 RepID=UPI003C79184D
MSKESLKEKFDEVAEHYDRQRESLIPCFHDFYSITVNLAQWKNNEPKILDMGAGTGLLTKFLFEKYPEAEFTLLDMSEEMLKVAKNRFRNYNNFKFITADYTTHNFNNKFDLIVSSLSIHHLEDIDKEKLYKKIYNTLNPEGIFLNADQVTGSTQNLDDNYQKNWIELIDNSNLNESEKVSALERMKFDKPATYEDNLKWLRNCGFEDVDIYYKYYNFCIFYAKKP